MVILHAAPLAVQIQGERTGPSGALDQSLFTGNHKTKARYALNTFVGRADQEIDIQRSHIDGNTTKTAHGIDDKGLAKLFDHCSNLGQRIEHAGGGLTMYYRHMSYIWLLLQHGGH